MYESLYDLLGVREDATTDEIKRAYRTAAQRYHPDKLDSGASAQERDAAEDRFKELHVAYEVLSSPSKRKDYDLTLEKKRDQDYVEKKLDEIESLISDGFNVKAIQVIGDLLDSHPRFPGAIDLKEHCGFLAYNHAWECFNKKRYTDAKTYFQLSVRYSSNQELISNAEEFLYELRARESSHEVASYAQNAKSSRQSEERHSDWGAELGHRLSRFAILGIGLIAIIKITSHDDVEQRQTMHAVKRVAPSSLGSYRNEERAINPPSAPVESFADRSEVVPRNKDDLDSQSFKVTERPKPAKRQQNKAEVDRWIRRIETIAMGQWIRPKNLKVKSPATLMVELGEDGDLIRVNTSKSSGDLSLDKSFEMAVRQAAPYTLPDDPNVAPYLRSFSLTLKPPW